MQFKRVFHYVSYLQYPLLLAAVATMAKPILGIIGGHDIQFSELIETFNNVLIFMGIGLSVSTLQDTSKTQNKLSKKIWQHPKKGKIALLMMAGLVFFFIVVGLLLYYAFDESNFKELAIGIIILGIGYLGVLRSAIEMFEHHRLDKNPSSN